MSPASGDTWLRITRLLSHAALHRVSRALAEHPAVSSPAHVMSLELLVLRQAVEELSGERRAKFGVRSSIDIVVY